ALLQARAAGRGRKKDLFLLAAGAALLTPLKIVGAQPVQWIARLPGLQTIHFITYLGIPLNFLLALMAAVGLDRVMTERVRPARLALTLLLIAAALLTIRQIATAKGALEHPAAAHWLKEWRFLLGIAAAGLVIVVAMATVRRWEAGSSRWLAIPFLVVFVVEAIHNTFYPRQYAWNVWRHPVPYVRALQKENRFGRV